MTTPTHEYDDIPGRTRQAWLRTNLGVVAVSLLTVRSLVLDGHGGWPVLLVLLPAVAFTAVSIWRGVVLRDGPGSTGGRGITTLAVASVLALAVVGGVTVGFGWPESL